MRMKESTTTTKTLGFRITGYHISHLLAEGSWTVNKLTKHEGRKLNEETVYYSLRHFFLMDSSSPRSHVVRLFLQKMIELQEAFREVDKAYRFFASSLLFIYDAEPGPDVKIVFKMIDFAHVYFHQYETSEDGYLFGLNHLISYFTRMMEGSEHPPVE
jgi:hypothetical protein